jgi:hypothetical protein
MSNDKDFVVNGPVVVGKDTKVTVGSIAAGTVDLSTGNYFVDSPSGDYTYTFANPGDVQAFQIQATGSSEAVASTFSTTLYTGNGGTQTITNGIDLSSDGGLVWFKNRTSATTNHSIFDSESGATGGTRLLPNLNNGLQTFNGTAVFTTSSTGFALNNDASNDLNDSIYNYVAWTFKKQTKFFDIVTYTGNGVARTISHNLGSVPGVIITKRLDSTSDWAVYHRSYGSGGPAGILNGTDAAFSLSTYWNNTDPTSTQFTLGSFANVNASGGTYVAYLFAHDTASDGLIQCGSYTGTAASQSINLGWKPQWLLIKSTGAADWYILDTTRGWTSTSLTNKMLNPNNSTAESTVGNVVYDIAHSNTGFDLASTASQFNASGQTYIYMAIRSASAPAITWPTNIEWPAGITPSTPAEGETDVYTFTTDDGGTTYTGVQSIDNAS